MERFFEAFLTAHALLILAYPFARRTKSLALLRLGLVACVLAPLAATAFEPRALFRLPLGWTSAHSVDDTKAVSAAVPLGAAALTAPSATGQALARHAWWLLIACGVAARGVILVRDARTLRRLLARSVRLRRRGKAEVLVSPDVAVPFAVRTPVRAAVVLPIGLLAAPRDVLIALAHEAQHHRNGDCLFTYVAEFLRAVFYINPAAHAWMRRLADCQEYACDEALVGRRRFSPHEYGRCLLHVARAASGTVPTAWALGLGRRETGLLHRRVEMLFEYRSRHAGRGVLVAGAALVASTMAFAYGARGTIAGEALEPRLQRIAETVLSDTVAKHAARGGVVAAVDVKTGHMLAFAEVTDWRTRVFPVASVVKPLIAAALETGTTRVDGCDVEETIVTSDNACAVRIAERLGRETVVQTLRTYGLEINGQPAAVATGEAVGGTVGEVLGAYVRLSKRGDLREMLENVVKRGTGRHAALPGVRVAGKTGTMDVDGNRLASFAGFAPAEAPEIAVYVVIENPSPARSETYGGIVAAPAFGRFVQEALAR